MQANIEGRQQVVSCVSGDITELQTRDIEQPGDGEILLAMRAVGLCGTDLFKLTTDAVSPGLVLGHELVGDVCAVGRNVDAFAIGDRVAVAHHVPCGRCAQCRRGSDTLCATFRENLLIPGAFAEFVLVRERAVRGAAHKIPSWMSDDIAVWMEPAACVLRGVTRAQLINEGLSIVLGAGSMGLLHLLVLKAQFPQIKVLVIDPLSERRDIARSLGADDCAAPGQAADLARKLSAGLGADAVFDTVGGAQTLSAALELSREGGSVILFAHAAQDEKSDFDLNSLFKYERRVLGSYSGGPEQQARVFELMTQGKLDPSPLVTHHLPLAEFAHGVQLARTRAAMKVVFVPTQGDERGNL
ncbi:MAG: L-iditol 2-dehydrogenase [Gammaproteobacteria bacterium]|jgi:L-iditol 2-dehydrogenase